MATFKNDAGEDVEAFTPEEVDERIEAAKAEVQAELDERLQSAESQRDELSERVESSTSELEELKQKLNRMSEKDANFSKFRKEMDEKQAKLDAEKAELEGKEGELSERLKQLEEGKAAELAAAKESILMGMVNGDEKLAASVRENLALLAGMPEETREQQIVKIQKAYLLSQEKPAPTPGNQSWYSGAGASNLNSKATGEADPELVDAARRFGLTEDQIEKNKSKLTK